MFVFIVFCSASGLHSASTFSFPVHQCLQVTQMLTEAGSIFDGICQQQCMTVEESFYIYRALYRMLPIDLHLPDTVTDRANQPIMALETDRHSFTGEMRWDGFE